MIVATASTWVAKKVADIAKERFKQFVIERWTKHRAEAFFESFSESLLKADEGGIYESKLDEQLDEILKDETKSEVLFDAYRKVAFSASRELGPRIIGILVGMLVAKGQRASESEEKVLLAASELNDSELYSFVKMYREACDGLRAGDKDFSQDGSDIIWNWCSEKEDTASPRKTEIETSPMCPELSFGAWSLKLAKLGFVRASVKMKREEYKEDSERHIDEDGVLTTYSHSYAISGDCKLLYDLTIRAVPIGDSDKT